MIIWSRRTFFFQADRSRRMHQAVSEWTMSVISEAKTLWWLIWEWAPQWHLHLPFSGSSSCSCVYPRPLCEFQHNPPASLNSLDETSKRLSFREETSHGFYPKSTERKIAYHCVGLEQAGLFAFGPCVAGLIHHLRWAVLILLSWLIVHSASAVFVSYSLWIIICK